MGGGMSMQLYQAAQFMFSLLGIVLFGVGAGMVFSTGRPSSGRNLTGAGMGINCLTGIAGLVMQILQQTVLRQTGGPQQSEWIFLFY